MKFSLKIWPALFIFAWVHTCVNIHSVSSRCLDDQMSLLLQLHNTLEFDPSISTKLVWWNKTTTDCCQWSGVQCHPSTGHIIGLDLSGEGISRGIDNPSSLFRLQSLQSLNLAYNHVLGRIPSALSNLSSLTYLNLSITSFSGQVPVEISQLVNLVVLDISMPQYGGYSPLQIKNPDLSMIIHNWTNIRELYLDGIVITAKGNKWGEAISSSLPYLQVLSMSYCNLVGGFHPSFATLHSLSVITLNKNNLSAPIPEFFAEFKKLTALSLFNCELRGIVPGKIFQLPALTTLDLSYNNMLQGTLPYYTGNLKRLHHVDLSYCNFHGIIPSSVGSLDQLEYVDLSNNNFFGPLPLFSSAKNLKFLQLSYNSLTGRIPISMLPMNSMLQFLDLKSNRLEGPIPKSIFQVKSLEVLALSWNKFNGTLELNEILSPLKNLFLLDLSNTHLSINTHGITTNSSFPQLRLLSLASCNLGALPEFLKNQQGLEYLDLSNCQIQGKVPRWLWDMGFSFLNLSCNNFVKLEQPLQPHISLLTYLDLHSNNLQGQLPAGFLSLSRNLDFSQNNFTSIDPNFGNSFSPSFLSLSENKIRGTIPTSICNATNVEVLDLAYNHFNGEIPDCLIAMTQTLQVLNLRENNLQGAIPNKFQKGCTLESINLNMNFLDGQIPTSLANCQVLKVLDLGNNKLNDTFPCQLIRLSSLQVIVLRSNRFHGTVGCPINNSILSPLQIVDLASNYFSGELPTKLFSKWIMMMAKPNETQSKLSFLQYKGRFRYYQDSVTVTFKGLQFVLQKILTIFISIDLSENSFHGKIPKELGNLIALKVLNLSHNSLSGNIPPSLGNLSQLESLDLCCNALNGNIPQQLASLNFLECLNLSFNKLSGLIPTGSQLQLFDASSYEGNQGLYGQPLTLDGRKAHAKGWTTPIIPDGSNWSSKIEFEWMLRGAEVGFPVGDTVVIGPLLYIKKWRQWYYKHVDRLVMKMLKRKDGARGRKQTRASRKQKKQRQ